MDTVLAVMIVVTSAGWTLQAHFCPIAAKGQEFSLECPGSLPKDIRFIHWISSKGGGKLKDIGNCYFADDCVLSDNAKERGFKVDWISTETHFSTKFSIDNVTNSMNGLQIKCELYNTETEDTHILMTCEIAVYHLAKPPTCQAVVQPNNTVTVSCRAPQVLPGIVCYLYNKETNTWITMDSIKTQLNSQYYSVSCSTNFRPVYSGSQSFQVKIVPEIATNIEDIEKHASFLTTNDVFANAKPSLRLTLPAVTKACHDTTNTLQFSCTAYMPDKPSLTCSMGGQVLNYKEVLVSNNVTNGNVFVKFNFTYQLKISPSDNGTVILCVAKDAKKPSEEIREWAVLVLSVPPTQPPVFIARDGTRFYSSLQVKVNLTATFYCQMDGVSAINVTCMGSNTRRSFLNASNIVAVSISGSEGIRTCVCAATHPSGCDLPQTRISITSGASTPHATSNNIRLLYYIVGSSVAVVVIVLLLTVIVVIYKYRHALYNYYNSPRSTQHVYTYIELPTIPIDQAPSLPDRPQSPTHETPPPVPHRPKSYEKHYVNQDVLTIPSQADGYNKLDFESGPEKSALARPDSPETTPKVFEEITDVSDAVTKHDSINDNLNEYIIATTPVEYFQTREKEVIPSAMSETYLDSSYSVNEPQCSRLSSSSFRQSPPSIRESSAIFHPLSPSIRQSPPSIRQSPPSIRQSPPSIRESSSSFPQSPISGCNDLNTADNLSRGLGTHCNIVHHNDSSDSNNDTDTDT
ncbi:uncharacterized protein LOC131951463 [Physella acuta]|uniref:uncharacterized protein LOC131951463 n=1 Tax=Physella acuta TaxID=109671 RepID=UPI0027DB49CD|nr:uncharacterized protein LOC131951463 [Physella acuta]XP_059169878.1 uncharacterized protein LOC131951463 [Physella acuta]XP_059169882.1 uncharacterized protein LOC131951463 [Physella acuta]